MINLHLQFQPMQHKEKLFSDTWILIIGIPLIGIAFPFFFGLRFSDPDFYRWMVISISSTLFSWLGTRLIVSFIWQRFPWEKNPLIHILLGLALIEISTLFTTALISALRWEFFLNEPPSWSSMRELHNGILIAVTFLVLLHEAIHLFFKWKHELTRVADLEKENLRSKFDALKNHINPHFLFNSLGTLSSLIRTDPVKAEEYVNEFSRIYRYFLEVNSNDLVTVGEELDFINSYVFLQQIRFGDGFRFQNKIDPAFNSSFILPLTLELLVENALKHNTIQIVSPLHIEVFADKDRDLLIVRNNYQPRQKGETTGTGLINLEQRYMNFLGTTIRYSHDGSYFTVEIPMIYKDA
jgi:two-component system, LytTR family, sensor kinase